ncbi:MAG: glutamate racemase [Ruminococcaceae bacterium]|nr:glutamate racemase [Oscillospiraceae bacterium]
MIGIFDSGLGGLTALTKLRKFAPDTDLLYFGDTARVPYGSRSVETITKYADEIISLLTEKGADSILAACGTVSTVALPKLKGKYSVPVSGILEPACAAAAKATKNGKIGVIATSASVNSGAYIREISSLLPNAQVVQTACPLFVPLVEGGFIGRDCEITRLAAQHYLAEIKEAGCDTLLLGCTHYPIIADVIGDMLEGVTLINASEEAARAVAASCNGGESGKVKLFLSDRTQDMEKIMAYLGAEKDYEIEIMPLNRE